eukprot:1146326-Pelagomonas_calceolata.AAC.1
MSLKVDHISGVFACNTATGTSKEMNCRGKTATEQADYMVEALISCKIFGDALDPAVLEQIMISDPQR